MWELATNEYQLLIKVYKIMITSHDLKITPKWAMIFHKTNNIVPARVEMWISYLSAIFTVKSQKLSSLLLLQDPTETDPPFPVNFVFM